MVDFGDYVEIEQRRYRGNNEMFVYKVIGGGMMSNRWTPVPVDANNLGPERGGMHDVINAVQCGVSEDTIEVFRLQDVVPLENFGKRENKEFIPYAVREPILEELLDE